MLNRFYSKVIIFKLSNFRSTPYISILTPKKLTPTYLYSPRPQAAAQIFLLAGLDKEAEPSPLMLGSIIGCIVSIGYLVATTELDLDTDRKSRTNSAPVHGYFPTSTVMQSIVVAGIVLFIAGYLAAKLLALVILASVMSFRSAAVWCCVEALTLLVLRYVVEGRWRFHIASLSGPIPSLVLHGVFYLGMLATPFPLLRYVPMLRAQGNILFINFTVIFFLNDHRDLKKYLTNKHLLNVILLNFIINCI